MVSLTESDLQRLGVELRAGGSAGSTLFVILPHMARRPRKADGHPLTDRHSWRILAQSWNHVGVSRGGTVSPVHAARTQGCR